VSATAFEEKKRKNGKKVFVLKLYIAGKADRPAP